MKLVFIGSGVERESTQLSGVEVASVAGAVRRRFDTLIFGGSRVGLMGAFASAFADRGGHVVSILPAWLEQHDLAFDRGETVRCDDLAERKRLMFEGADAVICYPGGIGTCDELFEVLTLHAVESAIAGRSGCPPIYLYNWDKFYAPLLLQLETSAEVGLIHPTSVDMIRPFESVDQLEVLLAAA